METFHGGVSFSLNLFISLTSLFKRTQAAAVNQIYYLLFISLHFPTKYIPCFDIYLEEKSTDFIFFIKPINQAENICCYLSLVFLEQTFTDETQFKLYKDIKEKKREGGEKKIEKLCF